MMSGVALGSISSTLPLVPAVKMRRIFTLLLFSHQRLPNHSVSQIICVSVSFFLLPLRLSRWVVDSEFALLDKPILQLSGQPS